MPQAVDPQRFSERLQKIIALAGCPKEVAYHTKVSPSSIYNYLNGRIPDFEIVARLARYAGVPIDYFVADENEIKHIRIRTLSASFAEDRPAEREELKLEKTGTG